MGMDCRRGGELGGGGQRGKNWNNYNRLNKDFKSYKKKKKTCNDDNYSVVFLAARSDHSVSQQNTFFSWV